MRRTDVDLDQTRSAIERVLLATLAETLRGAPDCISESIRYAVLAPGKRVRPLLVVAAYEASNGAAGRTEGTTRNDAIYRLACGVELVHAYSLVHDDLPCMDDDDLRRGRSTVHMEFGVRAAIFAGAALMPLAVEVVGDAATELGLTDPAAARLVRILTAASGGNGMVGGQLLDLRAEGRRVDLGELEAIHEGKTAKLIEASCMMGAAAAGGDEETISRLSRYGRALGLAFQVVDDILDVTGTPQSMGKAGGRDAELGKATHPMLVGLDRARERARVLVDRALAEIEPLPADGLEQLAHIVRDRQR